MVSNADQDLLLNPNDGTLSAADGNLTFSSPGGTPNVSAAAYTNSFAGAATTTLYDIDVRPGNAVLVQQNLPNTGALVVVGSLGVDVESANEFDIGSTTNMAYALPRSAGTTKVYSANLTSEAATAGAVLPGSPTVRGFTLGLGF